MGRMRRMGGMQPGGGRAKEAVNASEALRRKPHCELKAIVALENVWLAFPLAESFPIHKSSETGEVAVDRHGIIAAVDNAAHEGLAQAFGDVATANRDVEGAGVAVEIWVAVGHFGEDVKIFRVR